VPVREKLVHTQIGQWVLDELLEHTEGHGTDIAACQHNRPQIPSFSFILHFTLLSRRPVPIRSMYVVVGHASSLNMTSSWSTVAAPVVLVGFRPTAGFGSARSRDRHGARIARSGGSRRCVRRCYSNRSTTRSRAGPRNERRILCRTVRSWEGTEQFRLA